MMNVEEENTYSKVPDEMIIDISWTDDTNEISNEMIDDLAYLEHLTNHQQDDLLRKFIINERTLKPVARCADWFMRVRKN